MDSVGIFWACVAAVVIIWQWKKYRDREKAIAAADAFNRSQLVEYAGRIQERLDKVSTAKTTAARVNACESALAMLDTAMRAHPKHCRSVLSNYDELQVRLHAMKKVIPVVALVEKSNKYSFKGNQKSERNALLDALYIVQTESISSTDFTAADMAVPGTGEILTISTIPDRLKELGWEKPYAPQN